MPAPESHLGKLLLNLFLDTKEFWILALHWTFAGRLMELFQAFVVEATLT